MRVYIHTVVIAICILIFLYSFDLSFLARCCANINISLHGINTNKSEFDDYDLIMLLISCPQFGENRRMLQALRTLLEEFRVEVREEEARRRQLQQSYANDKAAWEVKWAQMKCQATTQVEPAHGRPIHTLKIHSRYTHPRYTLSRYTHPRYTDYTLCI